MSHPEQLDEELQGPGIFQDAIFTIIPSDDLKEEQLQQVHATSQDHNTL